MNKEKLIKDLQYEIGRYDGKLEKAISSENYYDAAMFKTIIDNCQSFLIDILEGRYDDESVKEEHENG